MCADISQYATKHQYDQYLYEKDNHKFFWMTFLFIFSFVCFWIKFGSRKLFFTNIDKKSFFNPIFNILQFTKNFVDNIHAFSFKNQEMVAKTFFMNVKNQKQKKI